MLRPTRKTWRQAWLFVALFAALCFALEGASVIAATAHG